MTGRRPIGFFRGLLAFIAVLGLTTVSEAGEIKLEHINDLGALSPGEDDRYTATLTLAGTVKGWEIDLSEFIFTDRYLNFYRFDETYLTVARNFTPGSNGWNVRAQAGAVHVGEGIFGESFQNLIHRILNQPELFLPYVEDGTHFVAGVRVSRPMEQTDRFTWTPYGEAQEAGFKRHALAAVEAHWELDRGFAVTAGAGWRLTRADFAELDFWIEESDPTFSVGASYKQLIELRWTKNYFGTGEGHWHLTLRFQIKKKP